MSNSDRTWLGLLRVAALSILVSISALIYCWSQDPIEPPSSGYHQFNKPEETTVVPDYLKNLMILKFLQTESIKDDNSLGGTARKDSELKEVWTDLEPWLLTSNAFNRWIPSSPELWHHPCQASKLSTRFEPSPQPERINLHTFKREESEWVDEVYPTVADDGLRRCPCHDLLLPLGEFPPLQGSSSPSNYRSGHSAEIPPPHEALIKACQAFSVNTIHTAIHGKMHSVTVGGVSFMVTESEAERMGIGPVKDQNVKLMFNRNDSRIAYLPPAYFDALKLKHSHESFSNTAV